MALIPPLKNPSFLMALSAPRTQVALSTPPRMPLVSCGISCKPGRPRRLSRSIGVRASTSGLSLSMYLFSPASLRQTSPYYQVASLTFFHRQRWPLGARHSLPLQHEVCQPGLFRPDVSGRPDRPQPEAYPRRLGRHHRALCRRPHTKLGPDLCVQQHVRH